MKYSIYKDTSTGLYHTTLLGGEYHNCHGQGKTKNEAIISLKIRIDQLKNKTK